MSNVLVVVDMQSEFTAAHFVKEKVLELIANRKAQGWVILVLEYASFGPTISGIRSDVLISKDEDCGANEVDKVLNDLGIRPRRIELCGVNRFACVADTHYGLQELGYYAYINEEASADENTLGNKSWSFTNRYGHKIHYDQGHCCRELAKRPFGKVKRYFNRLCRLLRLK